MGGALGGGVGSAAASPTPSFTKSFNSLLGLKKGIFLAGTSTFSPVFGLRPVRGLRWRVRKLPKPRISILSPARRERTTLSKMVSTITSLSLRVSSARRETSSIRSAFVIVPLNSPALNSEDLHNLLKFQGLYASLSFGAGPSAGQFPSWFAESPVLSESHPAKIARLPAGCHRVRDPDSSYRATQERSLAARPDGRHEDSSSVSPGRKNGRPSGD